SFQQYDQGAHPPGAGHSHSARCELVARGRRGDAREAPGVLQHAAGSRGDGLSPDHTQPHGCRAAGAGEEGDPAGETAPAVVPRQPAAGSWLGRRPTAVTSRKVLVDVPRDAGVGDEEAPQLAAIQPPAGESWTSEVLKTGKVDEIKLATELARL